MTPRRVVIIDTETTGTGDDAPAIEVAMILFDVPRASPLACWSSLLRHDENPAEAINGIAPELLREAPAPEEAWSAARSFAATADAFVAHGVAFDRLRVPAEVSGGRPWICSMDLPWPALVRPGESLVGLALRHGVGVASAHRAMADCDLLARLLVRAHEMGIDLGVLLAHGLRPRATFAASVSYSDRDAAKRAGFRWDAERRRWWREMAVADALTLAFPVVNLSDGSAMPPPDPEPAYDPQDLRRRAEEILARARKQEAPG